MKIKKSGLPAQSRKPMLVVALEEWAILGSNQ